MSSILCVDDDSLITRQLETQLREFGHEPFLTGHLRGAREALARRSFDLVLSTVRLPDGDALALLDELTDARVPVVMMTPYVRTDDAVDAVRRGALDYITKPIRRETLRLSVQHAIEHGRLARENQEFRRRVALLQAAPPFVGRSAELRRALEMVSSVSSTRATVLITGEVGTGKKSLARSIHQQSPRSDRPLVTVPCAAMSPVMLEADLFGATPGRDGEAGDSAFERARGGTLLLDEIAAISLDLQARLLRALQQQEFERAPESRPVRVDVRLIATTARDLREEVMYGRFRRDLFYRLSVVILQVPSLRERTEDLPLLATHFAERAAADLGISMPAIPAETLAFLGRHRWPGNVLELQTAIRRAVFLCRGGALVPEAFDLRSSLLDRTGTMPATLNVRALRDWAVARALEETGGHGGRAARLLGLSDRTLRNLRSRERGRRAEKSERPGDGDRPGAPPEF